MVNILSFEYLKLQNRSLVTFLIVSCLSTTLASSAPASADERSHTTSLGASSLSQNSDAPVQSACKSALSGASSKTVFFQIFKKEIEKSLDGVYLKRSDFTTGEFREAKVKNGSNLLIYILDAQDARFMFVAEPHRIFRGYKTTVIQFSKNKFFHEKFGENWANPSLYSEQKKAELLKQKLEYSAFVNNGVDVWSLKFETSDHPIYLTLGPGQMLVLTDEMPQFIKEADERRKAYDQAAALRRSESRGDRKVPLENILEDFLSTDDHD